MARNQGDALRGRPSGAFPGPLAGRHQARRHVESIARARGLAGAFAALTGTALPAGAAPDSFNVLPALLGQDDEKPLRDHLVFHVGGTAGPLAIREGPWKFIQPGKGGYGKAARGESETGPNGQLFNLAEDPGETTNLAAAQPAKVRQLQARLEKLRASPGSRR